MLVSGFHNVSPKPRRCWFSTSGKNGFLKSSCFCFILTLNLFIYMKYICYLISSSLFNYIYIYLCLHTHTRARAHRGGGTYVNARNEDEIWLIRRMPYSG